MAKSALVGTPPANDCDLAIVKGMLADFPPALLGKLTPEMGSPPSPSWPPPNRRNSDSTGGEIVASSVVVLFVLIIVTGTRLGARWTGKYSKIGWDDYFIVLAAVESLPPYFRLCIMANGVGFTGVSYRLGEFCLLLFTYVVLMYSPGRYPSFLPKLARAHWGLVLTTLHTRTRKDITTYAEALNTVSSFY